MNKIEKGFRRTFLALISELKSKSDNNMESSLHLGTVFKTQGQSIEQRCSMGLREEGKKIGKSRR